MNKSDQQLIADYLQGDEKSLEVLIGRYLKPIYSFVYRYIGGGQDTEDITQEVFVKVWRNLKKFDRQKSFKTWIFSIAKNTAIDFLKKKKVIPFSDFDTEDGGNIIADTFADMAKSSQEIFERKETAQMLESAMAELSPKYRTVLSLRYNSDFNFREIAETLGEPINTVKSRYRRALIILKNIFNK
ncbi:MAG: sigma-70 family RNA polymerase sigma factor [bacterium]